MNSYKNYVHLLRNILKNFDNDKFNYVIKNILSTVFDEYHMNRNVEIYCIDNLYKKYDISRYNFIKKKYGVVKNKNLIFRFNKYSKKYYIIKLLKRQRERDRQEWERKGERKDRKKDRVGEKQIGREP